MALGGFNGHFSVTMTNQPPRRRKWCRAQKEAKERTKESLWLFEAPARKMTLRMHTPTAQFSAGVGKRGMDSECACIWMHLVNGTSNSPSLGQPTPE